MQGKLKDHFYSHIAKAKALVESDRLDEAFSALEVAHVLGQRYPIPHTISHLYMLKVGLLKCDAKEVFGQLFRIPTGFMGSIIGVFPTGNTGGSNISPFKSLGIPEDIQRIINQKSGKNNE
jgi:hypothetical protein